MKVYVNKRQQLDSCNTVRQIIDRYPTAPFFSSKLLDPYLKLSKCHLKVIVTAYVGKFSLLVLLTSPKWIT